MLQQPVSLMYPLEIGCQDGSSKTSSNTEQPGEPQPIVDESSVDPTEEGPVSRQPTRTAASRAVDQMRRWISSLDNDDS